MKIKYKIVLDTQCPKHNIQETTPETTPEKCIKKTHRQVIAHC